ncbi:MAG: helix-turn-helix domain-containing protein [Actinomycetota bacterium]|nr:helix-turn-helix domain-containing protein [Actinomycetota bacterium]
MILLTLDELAAMLQKSPTAVRRMRERRQLPPAVVLGDRSVRWIEADVVRWLEARREVPPDVVPIKRGRPRKTSTSTGWRIS